MLDPKRRLQLALYKQWYKIIKPYYTCMHNYTLVAYQKYVNSMQLLLYQLTKQQDIQLVHDK